MRYGHLERVQVTLAVKSPLFIGSGQKLTPMEFILDGNTVHIPSVPRMLDALAHDWRRGLSDDLERFLLFPDRSRQLGAFIKNWNIAMRPTPAWVSYSLKVQPDVRGINTLLTFVRDPDGMAYIPGSSIKGALRTALIASRMGDGEIAALRSELEHDPRSRRPSDVERVLRVLGCQPERPQNAVNDLLRAVEVSDSAPFPADALTVCRRYWLSETGDNRGGKSPLFMECLAPGSETTLFLTVDRSLWPDGEDPLAALRGALTRWDALCKSACEQRFARFLADTGPAKGAPVVLGGGTGFQRKSLVYRTSPYPEEAARLAHDVLQSQFRTYRPGAAGTAPYKFKAAGYAGGLYPMGVCDLRL